MSHFLCVVVIPKDTSNIETKIEQLLSPYDENLSVPEYSRDCGCVGSSAIKQVQDLADREFGSMDSMRSRFHEENPVNYYQLTEDEQEAIDAKWETFIKPRIDFIQAQLAIHPDAKKADHDCECEGTGQRKVTYNPKSKWDWWQIGGRWTGAFDPSYDPDKDPSNIEICDLCGGTGKRTDMAVANGCNKCSGTGKAVKWPTQWKKFANDIVCVADLPSDTLPYALVTPEGEWLERGQMGWWGMTSGDKPKKVWAAEVKATFDRYKDCVAVAVDCHI